MSLLNDSKIAASLKKLLGKGHTDNAKEAANEALTSGITLSAGTVFGSQPPAAPSVGSLYALTGGTVEHVRLVLEVDASANGHAFRAKLPTDYESSSVNPKAGTGVFVNGQYLDQSAGKLQLVTPLFDAGYEAKPYRGGTGTKGSGTLVPPGDAVDWMLDYFNGVVFQENDPNTGPAPMTYLECLIWVGDFTDEAIAAGSSSADTIITTIANQQINIGQEVIDTVPLASYPAVKWIVTASKGTQLFASEVFAVGFDSQGDHTEYGQLEINNPGPNFCELDTDFNGGNLRLLATTDANAVDIKITRINVLN